MQLRYWSQLPELNALTDAQKRILFDAAERIANRPLVSASAFRRLLKAIAPENRLPHCLECGYDLRGSRSAIACPECGESILLLTE